MYNAAETLMAHSVGYFEDLFVVEMSDIKVYFEERGDRIRATMEMHGTVSIECSKQTFLERGGVEGMTETLVQMTNLAKIASMKPEYIKRLLQGDLERRRRRLTEDCCFRWRRVTLSRRHPLP